MKLPIKNVAWLLPLLLSGCFFNKPHVTQIQLLAPPIEDTPPPNPEPSPTNLPPPVITVPGQTTEPAVKEPQHTPPKPPVRRSKRAAAPVPAPIIQNENPGVSAVGQLSSGDATEQGQQTSASIAATEYGLNSIAGKLNQQEQKTATQIREFLRQARAALNSGDVDGAHTLAAKAKVLLGELSR
jgi:hypothetical protein